MRPTRTSGRILPESVEQSTVSTQASAKRSAFRRKSGQAGSHCFAQLRTGESPLAHLRNSASPCDDAIHAGSRPNHQRRRIWTKKERLAVLRSGRRGRAHTSHLGNCRVTMLTRCSVCIEFTSHFIRISPPQTSTARLPWLATSVRGDTRRCSRLPRRASGGACRENGCTSPARCRPWPRCSRRRRGPADRST